MKRMASCSPLVNNLFESEVNLSNSRQEATRKASNLSGRLQKTQSLAMTSPAAATLSPEKTVKNHEWLNEDRLHLPQQSYSGINLQANIDRINELLLAAEMLSSSCNERRKSSALHSCPKLSGSGDSLELLPNSTLVATKKKFVTFTCADFKRKPSARGSSPSFSDIPTPEVKRHRHILLAKKSQLMSCENIKQVRFEGCQEISITEFANYEDLLHSTKKTHDRHPPRAQPTPS